MEYGRIDRERLGPKGQFRLQAVDEAQAQDSGSTVFDWSHLRYVRALNHVGVVSIPGLTIEILPKISVADTTDDRQVQADEESKNLARGNLLYMLSVAGWLPHKEGNLSHLRLRRLPLLEAFVLVFALL